MAISSDPRLLSLLLLLSALSFSLGSSSMETVGQREFDYFVLCLQWPGTVCQSTHHCCSSNGCCRSQPLTDFTIHGLWPNYNDGSWPACCSHSDFDIKKVSSLVPELEKYWPSLYCSSPSLCFGGRGLFWAHEWEKHGTCSFPVIQDEYDYFSTVLDLYSKYNVTRILSSAGILANNGDRYPLGDVISTIKNVFGASPIVVCRHGSVEELRLCFYKDFKPRDCAMGSDIIDDASYLRSSCPRYVSLPTYAPLVLGDVSGATSWSNDHEDFEASQG
ncbi:ribonuclease 2 [Cocos nucifera]|uniref:Ribonuclease 2 n=1 Tax=Cocos nucifera TaxID=13894 RepID=A0A8K0HY18_COCNU|nr:ribonuclease 2 [Cocos nucifera]